jgi:peptidoglycan/LPS O-acetylase OafA/YrhL
VRSGEFRTDIEGLRAISIFVVVLYHAKVPLFSGGFVGVDVFFVISGFLITGLLLHEVERYQRIDLVAFWARRARRLLPNALLVLATTLLVTAAVFPFMQRQVTAQDIIAALLYFSNFRFAERSVDYFDQEVGSSPVLHFWSLSIEEQFYFFWPVVLVGLIWLHSGHSNRRVIWVLSVIACASFSFSLLWMSWSQPHAFFHTEARIWQLAVGALLAASYGRTLRLSPKFHSIFAWIGLSGIVASVIMFDDRLAYPGFWALIPVISTAAVIAGGSAGKLSPKLILGLAPLQWARPALVQRLSLALAIHDRSTLRISRATPRQLDRYRLGSSHFSSRIFVRGGTATARRARRPDARPQIGMRCRWWCCPLSRRYFRSHCRGWHSMTGNRGSSSPRCHSPKGMRSPPVFVVRELRKHQDGIGARNR